MPSVADFRCAGGLLRALGAQVAKRFGVRPACQRQYSPTNHMIRKCPNRIFLREGGSRESKKASQCFDAGGFEEQKDMPGMRTEL
jgi:hypothetical protein